MNHEKEMNNNTSNHIIDDVVLVPNRLLKGAAGPVPSYSEV
jgi:hypothetical protein